MADQVLALYGRMPQHTPDERIGLQGHVFVLAIAVIGVIKVYALCVQVQGSLMAQWSALDVACQIQGHTPPVRVRLAEFNVPVPRVLPADALAPMRRIPLGWQLQPLVGQGVAEVGQQLATKQRAQGVDRHQVVGLGVAPVPSCVEATGADQAVHMGVQAQGASPGVQGHQQARRGTQVALIQAQLQQAGAHAVEQEFVDPCPVEFPQRQEVVGQCEDGVKVRAR